MNEFSFRRTWGPKPKYERVLEYKHPDNDFSIISGSCSVESESQVNDVAKVVSKYATYLRGGVFRAGTYPSNNFGWVSENLLSAYRDSAKKNNLKNIIEVLDYRDIDKIEKYCDCFQVGARQQQNYTLLNELGKSGKPIFLKRNMGATVDEWLGSAEYLLKSGCKELYLIERGSSTYHNDVRWTPIIHIIPSIKSICNIPVIWDASHACGRRDIVSSVCLAGVAAGAGGILIETHNDPPNSLSDADQALNYEEYNSLMNKVLFVRSMLNEVSH